MFKGTIKGVRIIEHTTIGMKVSKMCWRAGLVFLWFSEEINASSHPLHYFLTIPCIIRVARVRSYRMQENLISFSMIDKWIYANDSPCWIQLRLNYYTAVLIQTGVSGQRLVSKENHFYRLTSNRRFHIRPKYKTLLRIPSFSLFHIHINKLFLFYLAAITSLKRKSQILPFRFTRRYTSNRNAYPTRVSGAKRVTFRTFIIEQFVIFFIRVAGIPWKNKARIVVCWIGIRVLAHLGRVCPAETIKGVALKRAQG